MTVHRAAAALGLVALLAAGGACDDGDDGDSGSELRFEAVVLPTPSGSAPRVAALATYGDEWWAAGSTIAADGTRSPALWRSTDAVDWREVSMAPVSFYGERAELYSVAAGPAGVVAIGSASGGAHGNPRTASWVLDGDVLHEIAAPFELYGGPRAISVKAVAAGANGFTIVGTRRTANERTGGATWVSTDGYEFTLIDDDPALQSEDHEMARPLAVAATPDGYIAAGDVRYRGRGTIDADGIVWTSPDGSHWARVAVGPDGLGVSGSVTVTAVDATLAAGVATSGDGGDAYVWQLDGDGGWRPSRIPGWQDKPAVTSVVDDAGTVIVGGRQDERPVVAGRHGDQWRLYVLPGTAPAGPHVDVDVAASSGIVVAAAADERAAGIWRAVGRSDERGVAVQGAGASALLASSSGSAGFDCFFSG